MITKINMKVLLRILLILSFVLIISLSVLAAASSADPLDYYWDGENSGDYYSEGQSSGDFYWDGENGADFYWDGENAGDYYWDGENAGDYYWDGENAGDYYWEGQDDYEYPEDDGTYWQGDSDFNTYDDSFEPETQPPFENPEDDVIEEPDDGDEEDPGFDPEPDDGDGDGPGPNQPARWFTLYNQSIPQGSPYNTIVYQSLATKCIDPDDPFVMTVLSKFVDFNLAFSGLDLVIRNLNPAYTGTSKIELDCNGIKNSFYLTIYPVGGDDDDEGDAAASYGIHISNIRIISEYGTVRPGEEIAIKTKVSNNGNKKLEDVKLTAVIQELGIKRSEGPFDLKPGNDVSKTVYLEIPERVNPGWYYIRLTLSDSDGEAKRIVHREIFIGEQ